MDFLNASDAKREFGDLLIKAQHAPIAINKNGKQVAVVLSSAEYGRLQAMKEQCLQVALQQGIDEVNSGKESNGVDVINRLRGRIR